MGDVHYLTCAETAKLVRTALRESFPGVKFSVRAKTYSGGASISVWWTDGPMRADVEAVARQFEAADFDGMIRVWIEPLFAEAKQWYGLNRFRLRRLSQVNIQTFMIAAGQN